MELWILGFVFSNNSGEYEEDEAAEKGGGDRRHSLINDIIPRKVPLQLLQYLLHKQLVSTLTAFYTVINWNCLSLHVTDVPEFARV